jgi:hypothetical protein
LYSGHLAVDSEGLRIGRIFGKDAVEGELFTDNGPELLYERALEKLGNQIFSVVLENAMKQLERLLLLLFIQA